MVKHEIEKARYCLNECTLREPFKVAIGNIKRRMELLKRDRRITDPNDLSYLRGALDMLDDVLNIPNAIIKMEDMRNRVNEIKHLRKTKNEQKRREINV